MNPPLSHTIRHRVLYAEADQMGYAHHSVHLVWFERGRIELLRAHGVSYRDLEASGLIMPVVEATTRYAAPARFDDELEITATLSELGRATAIFLYTIRRLGDGALIAEGSTRLGFCDSTGRPMRGGPAMLRQLAERAAGSRV